jgi:hypothetical protein
LLLGAPDPLAPPCIRQRFLPLTEGERQLAPIRVLAPHRGLARIGVVLRLWEPAIGVRSKPGSALNPDAA